MNVGMSLPPSDGATKGQRVALLVGVAVVFWLVLELFASVLLPFVAAAGVAYFLDPLASRLERAGVRRALGAGLLIFALLALGLLGGTVATAALRPFVTKSFQKISKDKFSLASGKAGHKFRLLNWRGAEGQSSKIIW